MEEPWSCHNPNGSWNGFIRSVIEDKIDVALWLSTHRDRALYSEVPVVVLFETFGIIKPVPAGSLNWLAMLYLFEPEVWLCTGLSRVLITSLFFAYFSKDAKYATGGCKTSRDSF